MVSSTRLCAALLVLSACGAGGPGDEPASFDGWGAQHVEPPAQGASRYDTEGLLDTGALELWHEAIGVTLDDLPSFGIHSSEVVTCNGGTNYRGCTYYPKEPGGTTYIAVRADLEGEDLRTTVAHELGHLMGFPGHLDDSALMGPYSHPGAPIDESVIEAVCSAGVVPCRWSRPTSEWRR